MQRVPRLLLTLVPVIALSAGSVGCTVHETYRAENALALRPLGAQIVGIMAADSQEVLFDQPGAQIQGDSLVAQIRGTPYSIPVARVQSVWIRRVDGKRSAIATLGGVAASVAVPIAVAGVALAISGGIAISSF